MNDIEYFDHTADVGFRLVRPAKEDLYRDAVFGMFDIIAPTKEYRKTVDYEITVTGKDLEELMVNWLSEFNL